MPGFCTHGVAMEPLLVLVKLVATGRALVANATLRKAPLVVTRHVQEVREPFMDTCRDAQTIDGLIAWADSSTGSGSGIVRCPREGAGPADRLPSVRLRPDVAP